MPPVSLYLVIRLIRLDCACQFNPQNYNAWFQFFLWYLVNVVFWCPRKEIRISRQLMTKWTKVSEKCWSDIFSHHNHYLQIIIPKSMPKIPGQRVWTSLQMVDFTNGSGLACPKNSNLRRFIVYIYFSLVTFFNCDE